VFIIIIIIMLAADIHIVLLPVYTVTGNINHSIKSVLFCRVTSAMNRYFNDHKVNTVCTIRRIKR